MYHICRSICETLIWFIFSTLTTLRYETDKFHRWKMKNPKKLDDLCKTEIRSEWIQTRTRVIWILALLEMLLASEIPRCPSFQPVALALHLWLLFQPEMRTRPGAHSFASYLLLLNLLAGLIYHGSFKFHT